MAFRFSLATVLRFRESVEKREELLLQKVLLGIARAHREIEQLNIAIAAAQDARNEAMQNPLPASHLLDVLNDIQAAVGRRNHLLDSLQTLDRQRVLQTQRYQAAHRERQMLSDIKTKQRDTYDQLQARTEQKFLDDIFIARSRQN